MSIAHFAETVVRRKLHAPDEWKAFAWNMLDDDICEVKGGIPNPTGKPWDGVKKRPHYGKGYAHTTEIDAARIAYQNETGNCADCLGTGQILARWSVSGGTEYRACDSCQGAGKE